MILTSQKIGVNGKKKYLNTSWLILLDRKHCVSYPLDHNSLSSYLKRYHTTDWVFSGKVQDGDEGEDWHQSDRETARLGLSLNLSLFW